MTAEKKAGNALAAFLKEIGPSRAVERFLSGYGNVRTGASYACELALYFRWLREKGVPMTPDQLISDNLKCVFESRPTDVEAKRTHTDLLAEYVNVYLVSQDFSESKRSAAVASIRGFYRANDSELFGHYKTASQKLEQPPKPLAAEDIRKVLLAMPSRMRTPLLISWQSGIEINRVLEMEFPTDQAPPVKVELYGRKGHRKGYSTFIGRDSVEHLRALGPKGFPEYSVMWKHLKQVARRLGQSGLLKNPELRSWHPHALRHSFETEAAHAGVKAEIRDYFEGHVEGIRWVYNHTDELHPADLVSEYAKIEPFVSLEPTEAAIKNEYQGRENILLKRLEGLEALYADLKRELLSSQQTQRPSQRADA